MEITYLSGLDDFGLWKLTLEYIWLFISFSSFWSDVAFHEKRHKPIYFSLKLHKVLQKETFSILLHE